MIPRTPREKFAGIRITPVKSLQIFLETAAPSSEKIRIFDTENEVDDAFNPLRVGQGVDHFFCKKAIFSPKGFFKGDYRTSFKIWEFDERIFLADEVLRPKQTWKVCECERKVRRKKIES